MLARVTRILTTKATKGAPVQKYHPLSLTFKTSSARKTTPRKSSRCSWSEAMTEHHFSRIQTNAHHLREEHAVERPRAGCWPMKSFLTAGYLFSRLVMFSRYSKSSSSLVSREARESRVSNCGVQIVVILIWLDWGTDAMLVGSMLITRSVVDCYDEGRASSLKTFLRDGLLKFVSVWET